MKLTKGKIARLHKTKRQSVKKQKWNKKHRNVKNLMSLNQKISSHLANKSMKKYKKVGGELVQYGGEELNRDAIRILRADIEKTTNEIIAYGQTLNNTLNRHSFNYAEFMCQIFNQPSYNINLLKKNTNQEIVQIKDMNIGFLMATSSGVLKVIDYTGAVYVNGQPERHSSRITAINSNLNYIISGDENGHLQLFNFTGAPPNQYKHIYIVGSPSIVSLEISRDNNHCLVTYVRTPKTPEEFKPEMTSINLDTGLPIGANSFEKFYEKLWAWVKGKQYNIYYSKPIRYMAQHNSLNKIAMCRDHVVDIIMMGNDGVVLDDDSENKVLVSKFLDGFNVAQFSPGVPGGLDSKLIACGCKSTLTIWDYNTQDKEIINYKYQVNLSDEITSILFTDTKVFCGLRNGSIQINEYNYNPGAPPANRVFTFTNLQYQIQWVVGHVSKVNTIFEINNAPGGALLLGGPAVVRDIFSCSDDGTVRRTTYNPGVTALGSSIIHSGSEVLTPLPPNVFQNVVFQLESDSLPDGLTINTITGLVNNTALANAANYNAYQAEFALELLAYRNSGDFSSVTVLLDSAVNTRLSREQSVINDIAAKKALSAQELAALINSLGPAQLSQSEKEQKVNSKKREIDTINQGLDNNKILLMEEIYNTFLKTVLKALTDYKTAETKRLEKSFKVIESIVLKYVYKCIFEAVDSVNAVYDGIFRLLGNTSNTEISKAFKDAIQIKTEFKSRMKQPSYPTYWNSLAEIETIHREEDHSGFVMPLNGVDNNETRRQQVLLEASTIVPKTAADNMVYTELLWLYDLIGLMYGNIRMYNIDMDNLNEFQVKYKNNDLYTEEVLDILCQTSVLSSDAYVDIIKFAKSFKSSNENLHLHNSEIAFVFDGTVNIDGSYYSATQLNEFTQFAREEYKAVPTRKMLMDDYNKKRQKLFQSSPIFEEILKQSQQLGNDPAQTLQFNFSKVNISPTQEKALQDFKKSVYELQKLYLQNNIFYMRDLSKTYEMMPSTPPRTDLPVNKPTSDVSKPQTNADIDSWEKLKNILLDPSNPRSDQTFKRWFKVLQDNMVYTEKELFDMTPGVLDKLKADSTWNDLKNQVSGKLGFKESLNRAKLNREILKKDDNGKLINEKFLQQILNNNKNPRSFARYTELKDTLSKNGITTEGSLSLLTDSIISKLDKQFQPLMREYVKSINPTAFAANVNKLSTTETPLTPKVGVVEKDTFNSLPDEVKQQLVDDGKGNYTLPSDANKELVDQLGDKIVYYEKSADGTLTKPEQMTTAQQPTISTSYSQPQQQQQQPGQTMSATPNQFQPQQQQQQPGQTMSATPNQFQPQQPSQLTNEQIGKAAEILINEFAYKIGPIINNLPYGEQQSTSSVSQAALALVKGVNERITNVQPDVNQLSGQLIEKSDANSNLQAQIDELKKEIERNKMGSVNAVDETQVKSQDQSSSNIGQTELTGTNLGEPQETSTQNNSLQQQVASTPSTVELSDDMKFVHEMVDKTNPPWVATLKSSQSIRGGGQQGGGLQGIDDLHNVLNCYAARLQRLDTGDTNTKITKFEVNHGLVEKWHKKKTGERIVNVIAVPTTSTILTINDLYQKDKTFNSELEYNNILYIKFLMHKSVKEISFNKTEFLSSLNKKTEDPNFKLKDETTNSFFQVSFVCLEFDGTLEGNNNFPYHIVDKSKFENCRIELKTFLQNHVNITTVKFLVDDENQDYVQPEYEGKAVNIDFKDTNIDTLKVLRENVLFLKTIQWSKS